MLKEKTNLLAPLRGRITPRQVLEAYETTGLIPGTGRFYDDGRACALGAIAAVATPGSPHSGTGVRPTDDWGGVFDRIGLNRNYMKSYIRGFDGETPSKYDSTPETRKGFRDGARARKFVFASCGSPERATGGEQSPIRKALDD